MLYQRKTLPNTLVGDPAALPAELVGLSDACLADLSASVPDAAEELGYVNQGFFPVPPVPPPVDQMDKVDFVRLFTQPERITIRQAAKVNPQVEDYQYMLDQASVVRLSDPDIQAGVPALEAAGLIGAGRAAKILAGEAP